MLHFWSPISISTFWFLNFSSCTFPSYIFRSRIFRSCNFQSCNFRSYIFSPQCKSHCVFREYILLPLIYPTQIKNTHFTKNRMAIPPVGHVRWVLKGHASDKVEHRCRTEGWIDGKRRAGRRWTDDVKDWSNEQWWNVYNCSKKQATTENFDIWSDLWLQKWRWNLRRISVVKFAYMGAYRNIATAYNELLCHYKTVVSTMSVYK